MSIVVIDPGHGGNKKVDGSSHNNATGPNGTKEKTLTLDIGLRVEPLLADKGHQVRLTRTTDVNLGLEARARVANSQQAHTFVSIHFNGWLDPRVQGTEVLVHLNASNRSKQLASCLLQQLVLTTRYTNRGLKSDALGVLNPIYHNYSTAACLIEISFITDPNDETRLADDDYKQSLARAIVRGIEDYLNGVHGFALPMVTPNEFTGDDIDI